jgi:hypothetical protein
MLGAVVGRQATGADHAVGRGHTGDSNQRGGAGQHNRNALSSLCRERWCVAGGNASAPPRDRSGTSGAIPKKLPRNLFWPECFTEADGISMVTENEVRVDGKIAV